MRWIIIFTLMVGVLGCGILSSETETAADSTQAKADAQKEVAKQKAVSATAILSPMSDSIGTGMVKFNSDGQTVQLKGEFYGFTAGAHGLRILKIKTCNLKAAHDEYGQSEQPADEPHLQDIGDLEISETGDAVIEITENISLSGTDSVIGHVVVIYAGKDDLNYQEVKNADARVACGPIVLD